jgi:CubicO group peptidase (beta-lactamase class C family)
VASHAFPGGVVAALHRGSIVLLHPFGRFTYEASAPGVTAETIFDLASLTKVVATTSAAMLLHQRGKLDLDSSVGAQLHEFAQTGASQAGIAKAGVTLRMLLDHTSGLPAHVKFYEHAGGRDAVLAAACDTPLEAAPGARCVYSDVGFILLGAILERIAGSPLDEFCRREIFAPLELEHTRFNPLMEWKNLIPPTRQLCPFRQRSIQGEVNDENAAAMGGIAGHAGLFAPATDLLRFADALLRGAPLFAASTITLFTQREADSLGSFALGWDTPTPPSQSGRMFSPRSFGHLGYTGTSLWIDPERQLAVVLLTNRTWPTPDSPSFAEI